MKSANNFLISIETLLQGLALLRPSHISDARRF
jgi:hypothetical protein